MIKFLQRFGVYIGCSWSNNKLRPKCWYQTNKFKDYTYRFRLHFIKSSRTLKFQNNKKLVLKPLYTPNEKELSFFEEFLKWIRMKFYETNL